MEYSVGSNRLLKVFLELFLLNNNKLLLLKVQEESKFNNILTLKISNKSQNIWLMRVINFDHLLFKIIHYPSLQHVPRQKSLNIIIISFPQIDQVAIRKLWKMQVTFLKAISYLIKVYHIEVQSINRIFRKKLDMHNPRGSPTISQNGHQVTGTTNINSQMWSLENSFLNAALKNKHWN